MAENNVSLTELKGLTEPLTKLIEVVSAGVGVWYEPSRIRKKAKAEAEAAIVVAEANAKVMDINARAQERVATREAKRQKNIESIAEKASQELPPEVNHQPVDPDWTTYFFDQCQDIQNEEMQNLWAKLLAGEVARPGSFSLRTLSLVKVLRKEDAHLFTRLCSCSWHLIQDLNVVVYGDGDSIDACGLRFEDLVHLESLGLLRFEPLSGFKLNFTRHGPAAFLFAQYFKVRHALTFPEGVSELEIGKVMLTSLGRELAPVAGGQPDEAYRARMIGRWQKRNIEVRELP